MKVFQALVLLILLSGFSFAAPVPPGDISFCLQIVNPGTYTLTTDLVDGLIALDSGENGCYWINTSNVVLDCQGHSITSTNGTPVGVYIFQALDNVTVKNCEINGFAYAISIQGTQSGNLTGLNILNNTLNSTDVDMAVYRVDGAIVDGNTADPTLDFLLVSNSLISNNFVSGTGSSGINLRGESASLTSSNNTLLNNTVLGVGKHGFHIDYAVDNTFLNNTAAENGRSGFFVDSTSPDNKFIGNIARNNSLANIYTAGFDINSVRNLLINNTAYNNSNGIYLSADNNNLSNNHIYHNYLGLNLDQMSDSNLVVDNLIEENEYTDLLVAGDPRTLEFDISGCNNTIENNTGSGGRPILYSENPVNLVGGIYSEIILCNADNSVLDGVTVDGSDTFDNNALALFFTDNTVINNSQSNNNAMGVWLYGSDMILINNTDTNENAIAGLFFTLSRNIFVNQHLAHDNSGSIPELFGDEAGFLGMLPLGAGVFEIGFLPFGREMDMGGSTSFEFTYYNDSQFYDNDLGFMLMFTPNVTIDNSKIYDNSLFGILDMSGGVPGMNVVNTDLYRNGKDVMQFMSSSFGGEEIEEQQMPEFPEGLIWAEVFEANYLLASMFGGEVPSLPWQLEKARHGNWAPSVEISLLDNAEAIYITSETILGSTDSITYFDGIYNRTLFFNLTKPENKSSVKNKYFIIMVMTDQKAPMIEEFAVSWENSEVSGYDPATMGLYYLNVTDIIRPKSVEPTNITIVADWVPVEDQVLEPNWIYVENGLPTPENQLLRNLFPTIPEFELYEGIYGLFAVPVPMDGSNDDGGAEQLSVSVKSECDGTTVTVTDGGESVSGAKVLVSNAQSLASLSVGTTNGDGKFTFDECGMTVKIYVNKNGYSPVSLSKSISCCEDGEPEPKPEPEPEPEPQPEPQPEAEPQPEPEDEDDLPECPGECGPDANCDACSTGYTCVDYSCEKNDVSGEDGFVGDSKKVKVKIGNEPCPLCDIQVTAPDGKTFTGKTDENGEFSLPLSLEGPYKIILVDENGEVAAETIIQSLPKPALQVETKPTAEDDGDP
ncbi:MAG: right-handed parallel beta-helix repeat-containing protein, partial [Candidatus Micrarchaeota archaeon]